ncbi:hypothetical protein MPNT_210051 [Candidatus Methylacidithermus pantelleriae]|uniref:Uncharacterized protein n=1 Tax=Candidatus Methylacidithermus pantelleriae TaxID=2744239 RepID=A0A8J2BTA8_9BACT|nr:hypothetical protein MPNT_210051 [Candidatus Methylacidithermus pantelleriae]
MLGLLKAFSLGVRWGSSLKGTRQFRWNRENGRTYLPVFHKGTGDIRHRCVASLVGDTTP